MSLKKIIDGLMRTIEITIMVALAVMVALVFTNVVMRYGFWEGIGIL